MKFLGIFLNERKTDINKKPKRLENSQLVTKNLSKLQRRATIVDSTKQTTIISGQMSLHS